MKPSPRYLIAIEPVRLASPRAGTSAEKQTFDFFIKPDRVYHELKFAANEGCHYSQEDDPRLLKRWLLESERRILSGQLDYIYRDGEMDLFLFKNPFGNFYDLERLKGAERAADLIMPGELYANFTVMTPYGKLFLA